jgi:BirA family biotin operon repressor/biotin-[acetyl-CoA-carboxylase] ligase
MKRVTYERIGSTNDAARRLMSSHPGEPLVVAAHEQTAGRGRLGRTWTSPPGGLWMTIVWPARRRPNDHEADGNPTSALGESAPLLAGLAAWRAIASECFTTHANARDAGLRIKWPNDLLLNGRKIAGVLCERFPVAQPRADAQPTTDDPTLLIGIGVNANFDDDELQHHDMRHHATTLRTALGRSIDAHALADRLIAEFVALADDALAPATSATAHDANAQTLASLSPDIRDELAGVLALMNEPVTFGAGAERRAGIVRGLDQYGRLLIDIDGAIEACASGEVDRLRHAHDDNHDSTPAPAGAIMENAQ